MEGEPSWDKVKSNPTEAFHLDPQKQGDVVEGLLERYGTEGAVDEIMDRLDRNPEDQEIRREANLLLNRLDDLSSRLRGKVQH